MTAVLAHGLGVRAELPVPLWLGLASAALVLLVSFGVLIRLWHRPRYEPDGRAASGRPVPPALQRFADARATRVALRAVGVLAVGALVVTLALGPDNIALNPGMTWFYVWFWVGLVPFSLLFGPVWKLLNPLRAVSGALAYFAGDPHGETARPLPPKLGYWPAAAGLFAFVWLELCFPNPDDPISLLVFLNVYTLAQLAGAMVYGQAWFDRGDAFEAYSSLIARLAPVGRRPDGRLVFRSPLAGLAGLPPEPGLVGIVCVLLGATVFDGLTQIGWWASNFEAMDGTLGLVLISTAALALAIGLVAFTFGLATASSARLLDGQEGDPLPRLFAHSLVPIAIGYTIAHYFSLAVLQGQIGYIAASDPLGLGWNLFGTADWGINDRVVTGLGMAAIQIGAIVVGHVIGAVSAHDRAVSVFPARVSTRGQFTLIGVMVLYTVAGITLVTAP
jgi:hypothetical protein